MMGIYRLLWAFSAVFLGVYAVVQDLNVPLIVQPQLFAALSYLSWAQVSLPPPLEPPNDVPNASS